MTGYYQGLEFIFGSTYKKPMSGFITLHNRQYYCLQYNHGGRISVKVDDLPPVEVTGPSLLITSPGRDFVFGTHAPQSWLHNALGFKGEYVQRLVAGGLLPEQASPPVFPVRDSASFMALFEQCCFYINRGERYVHRAAYALEGMLLQLYDERAFPAAQSHLKDRINALAGEITVNFDRDWDFEAEAASLHISYAHFRRVFKEVTGKSPQKYLQHNRLSHAAELLLTTGIPIKGIALAIGIEDIHYFTRIFTALYKSPPGKFREEHGIAR